MNPHRYEKMVMVNYLEKIYCGMYYTISMHTDKYMDGYTYISNTNSS